MDNDVFVRPGWLPPLVRCQNETSAGLVVPLVLEDEHRVHCAGCDMFVSKKGNRSFVGKALRYHGQTVFEDTNIKRRELDYGEMHLQLVDTRAALELGVYDERIQEGQELDGGLAWRKAGRRSGASRNWSWSTTYRWVLSTPTTLRSFAGVGMPPTLSQVTRSCTKNGTWT